MTKYIESESDVKSFLSRLNYGLTNGAQIQCMMQRVKDKDRDVRFSNHYTLSNLFPNENPTDALRKELLKLKPENYIETIKDSMYPNRSDMRVFGLEYFSGDVYTKIRVELLDSNSSNNHTVFVMSFHFAEWPINKEKYPYRKS